MDHANTQIIRSDSSKSDEQQQNTKEFKKQSKTNNIQKKYTDFDRTSSGYDSSS